jgi:FixJ family two-component response regulator
MPHAEALLIVDDTKAERQLMEMTLAAAFPKADVQCASHPSQAKAMCEAHHFDCVLVDYNMPEMDGLTLAHQLKAADSYLATVPMTSVGDETLAAEALRTGISDYIPKGRITAESIQRSVARSILACSRARVIDAKRLELENFASAMAHDFKRPIRQITTFAMLIAEQLRDVQVGDVQRRLAFLTGAASRLGKLVDVMSQYTLLNRPPDLADVDLGRTIWCESELGQGSVFRVSLPAADKAGEAQERGPEPRGHDREHGPTAPVGVAGAAGNIGGRLQQGPETARDGMTFDLTRRIETLSMRERQVGNSLVAGASNKDIASELGLSPRTVEIYRAKLMNKMQAGSFAELVRMAMTAGGQRLGGSRASPAACAGGSGSRWP